MANKENCINWKQLWLAVPTTVFSILVNLSNGWWTTSGPNSFNDKKEDQYIISGLSADKSICILQTVKENFLISSNKKDCFKEGPLLFLEAAIVCLFANNAG